MIRKVEVSVCFILSQSLTHSLTCSLTLSLSSTAAIHIGIHFMTQSNSIRIELRKCKKIKKKQHNTPYNNNNNYNNNTSSLKSYAYLKNPLTDLLIYNSSHSHLFAILILFYTKILKSPHLIFLCVFFFVSSERACEAFGFEGRVV